jgi:hypothetical protein
MDGTGVTSDAVSNSSGFRAVVWRSQAPELKTIHMRMK